MRALLASTVLSLLFGWSGAAQADYGYEDEAWNGLAYLATTAEEASVQLGATEVVDLEQLRPRDVLWILYPTKELPVRDLVAFVREGGRLILADDHGTSGPLLEALGVERRARPTGPSESFAEGRPSLPILLTDAPHFVFFNVDEVVANHPAAISGEGTPLLSFAGGQEHLVSEVRLGAGQVLVISDPSIFVNAMLRRFYGNKQFAANVLRVYCPRDTCHVTLALPATTYTGSYRKGLGMMGDAPAVFRDAGLMIDEGLSWFSGLLSGRIGGDVLMLLLLWATIAILWLQLRGRRDAPQPPPLAGSPAPPSPMEIERYGLSGAREDADFQVQARTLIAEAQAMVSRSGGAPLKESPPWLRIHAALLSLEANESSLVTAEQFLALSADVDELRRMATSRG